MPRKAASRASGEALEAVAQSDDEAAEQNPSPRRKTPTTAGSASPSSRSQAAEEPPILELLLQSSAAASVGSEWSRKFAQLSKQADKHNALRALVCLILQAAAGPAANLSSEEFEQEEVEDIVKRCAVSDKEDADPLSGRQKKFKSLRTKYSQFWHGLVGGIVDSSLLADEYLLPKLTQWLQAVSSMPLRPFRSSATLAALEIMTGLIQQAASKGKESGTLSLQSQAEKRKQKSNQSAVAKMASMSSEVHEALLERFKILNDDVFSARYLDVVPEMRVQCVKALGHWLALYPSQLLSDAQHIKFLGWMLNDRAPEVRVASLDALLSVFQSKEVGSLADDFIHRFKKRIVEIATADISQAAALAAIAVCEWLAEHPDVPAVQRGKPKQGSALGQPYLSDGEVYAVVKLMASAEESLRAAAARIFVKRLAKAEEASIGAPLDVFLKLLDAGGVSHAPNYVVDALWGSAMPALLRDPADIIEAVSTEKKKLSMEHRLLLVRVATALVKRASGVQICPRERSSKVALPEAELKKYTQPFLGTLPGLIKKYRDNVEELAELVEVPQLLDLQAYKLTRKEKELRDLLVAMKDTFLRCSDAGVLAACSASFRVLTAPWDLSDQAQASFAELCDELVATLVGAKDALLAPDSSKVEEPLFVMLNCLRRLEPLLTHHDMSQHINDIQTVLTDLVKHRDTLGNGQEFHLIFALALRCSFRIALWAFHELDPDVQKSLRALVTKRDRVVSMLELALGPSMDPSLKHNALTVLADFLSVFPEHLSGPLESLRFSLSEQHRNLVADAYEAILKAEALDEEEKESATIALAKILAHGGISGRAAWLLLGQLVSSREWIGDVVRAALRSFRANLKNPEDDAELMFQALKSSVEAAAGPSRRGKQQADDDQLAADRVFATKLAATYGPYAVATSRFAVSLWSLHQRCHAYGLQKSANARIFALLQPFSSKLTKESAAAMLSILQNAVAQLPPARQPADDRKEWDPYFLYLENLVRLAENRTKGKGKPRAVPLQLVPPITPLPTPSLAVRAQPNRAGASRGRRPSDLEDAGREGNEAGDESPPPPVKKAKQSVASARLSDTNAAARRKRPARGALAEDAEEEEANPSASPRSAAEPMAKLETVHAVKEEPKPKKRGVSATRAAAPLSPAHAAAGGSDGGDDLRSSEEEAPPPQKARGRLPKVSEVAQRISLSTAAAPPASPPRQRRKRAK